VTSDVRASWDAEYRAQRYVDEPPVAFVDRIVATVRARPALASKRGLYVGCGNGRNFLPLLDAGLDLDGVDLSSEALDQLRHRRPGLADRLSCADFRDGPTVRRYAYLIAIQVFQHGTAADARAWFGAAARALLPGGVLFVRVNSAATEIFHAHAVLERAATGGLTVRYDAGPKAGLAVHFYARTELDALTREAFVAIGEISEEVRRREPPKTGCWSQWEGIWQRR
jgi:SAM-dependent methyltransferase